MNITEIAALAGVSKAAVSRYFNGGYLSRDKKEAIAAVVAETGYCPSPQAQTLRTSKTCQIGVIIPKLASESTARTVDGISGVLSENGYQMLLAVTANQPGREVEYLELFRTHRVDGIILIATVFLPEHKKIIADMHIPVIIIGQNYDGYDCVYHDDRGAAKDATKLLISAGCRRPGFIGVTQNDEAAGRARQVGFEDALADAGIKPIKRFMSLSDFTMEAGYKKAAAMLCGEDRPDGIFCATDSIAQGVLQYCLENKISVPKELKLCGVGDNNLSRFCTVTISSAHLHYKTAGMEAAEMLISMIGKKRSGRHALKLGYEIISRQSTAK